MKEKVSSVELENADLKARVEAASSEKGEMGGKLAASEEKLVKMKGEA